MPSGLVTTGQGFQIARGGSRIVHPLPQQFAAVDQVDGQALELVFVGKVAPQGVVRPELAQGLEGQGLEAPGAEFLVIIAGTFDVDLQPGAELAGMFMEGRLEPAFPQPAADQPVRGQGMSDQHPAEYGAFVLAELDPGGWTGNEA